MHIFQLKMCFLTKKSQFTPNWLRDGDKLARREDVATNRLKTKISTLRWDIETSRTACAEKQKQYEQNKEREEKNHHKTGIHKIVDSDNLADQTIWFLCQLSYVRLNFVYGHTVCNGIQIHRKTHQKRNNTVICWLISTNNNSNSNIKKTFRSIFMAYFGIFHRWCVSI